LEFYRLDHNGRERSYGVHAAGGGGAMRAAVVVLHGGGANAEGAERMSDMSDKAEREGFVAVYPNGSGLRPNALLTWNAGHCCGYARDNNVDDVGFLAALLRVLPERHHIDADRIYVTGFSNGAMMAHRLARDYSPLVAAFAAVAGAAPLLGAPERPVPAMMFHGDLDEHAPIAGGHGARTIYARLDPPAHVIAATWAEVNGCDAIPQTEETPNYLKETWKNGREGSETVFYTVRGQGHAWPGGKSGIRFGNVDEPSTALAATHLMWTFFKNHARRTTGAQR